MILLFFSAGYYTWFKIMEQKPEAFVRSDFLFIFQTRNLFSLFNRLNESRLLDTIFYDREMKEMYRILVDVKLQLSRSSSSLLSLINFPATLVMKPDHRIFIVFDTGLRTPLLQASSFVFKNLLSGSEKYSFSRTRYKDFIIQKITLLEKRQNLYFLQRKNLLLFSTERSVLMDCADHFLSRDNLLGNENYLQVRAQIAGSRILRIYFNTAYLLAEIKNRNPELYQTLRSFSILNIAGVDLDIGKEEVGMTGFISTAIQDEALTRFFPRAPTGISSLNILPDKTEDFITLTFHNFQDVWNSFNRILVLTEQKEKQAELTRNQKYIEGLFSLTMDELLFSWLAQEVTLAHVKGYEDPVVVMGVKDTRKMKDLFSRLYEKAILTRFSTIKYKGRDIHQIKLSSFFEFLSSLLSPDLIMPYYTLYNDFILFSRSQDTIKAMIDSLEKDELILFNEKVKKIYSQIREGNILSYWDLSEKSMKGMDASGLFTRIMKNYNYGMVSLEFSDKGIKSRFVLTEPKASGIRVMKDWPLQLHSSVWAPPFLHRIEAKELEDILFGTESGKVYIYDIFAESIMNWPVKMDGDLRSSPFLFNHPVKKEMCVGAVSVQGRIFLWDKNGFLVPPFPVALEGDMEKTPLIKDINNDGRPEMILANDKGKIFVINGNGELLPGFPVEVEKSVSPDILLLDINKDKNEEILCSTRSRDGSLVFINNTAEINRDKVLSTGTLNISAPVILKQDDNSFYILLVTGDGMLFIWDQSLKLIPDFPLAFNAKFVNSPVAGDIDLDGKKEVLLVDSRGKIYACQFNGRVIMQQDLDFKPLENEPILLFDVNHDSYPEMIIPGTDNQIRFYDRNFSLLYTISGSFTPVIKDVDKDGKYEIITATDDGNVCFYKAP
ncbi:MAG: DUF3352 domain-containing protein [bacterium]|nr:DUF3352 domain-containing protein [bacterium]